MLTSHSYGRALSGEIRIDRLPWDRVGVLRIRQRLPGGVQVLLILQSLEQIDILDGGVKAKIGIRALYADVGASTRCAAREEPPGRRQDDYGDDDEADLSEPVAWLRIDGILGHDACCPCCGIWEIRGPPIHGRPRDLAREPHLGRVRLVRVR